jgi:thiamine-monophosphate kinase
VPSEFSLIERYFARPAPRAVLGAGDDGALVRVAPGMELVISTDMLVAERHFAADTDPEALGWKTLAVNISDLAAMGAQPRWAVIAVALADADETWIAAFARGLFACADAYEIDIVGGDTTRGPLNLCPTVFGEVPQGCALLRSGARSGDEIWVSGSPGCAALALAHMQGRYILSEPALTNFVTALTRPQPRVALGLALRGLASAAIDVSDGLAADLGHILERSAVAAILHLECLPDTVLKACSDTDLGLSCLLSGGDDYELVFTAPASRHEEIIQLSIRLDLPLTRIGIIQAGPAGQLTLLDADRRPLPITKRGFDHFAS